MRVQVPVNGEISFAPRAFDCLLISAIKPGGKVEALGLRTGDKLIAVDGFAYDSYKTFQARVDLSMAADNTTWTVMRDQVEIEVTFSGKAVAEALNNKRQTREDIDFDRGFRD
jgi:S1-C subfamily serine protease